MRAYIIRRILLMIPTLFGVTLVTFTVMQFAPGDPLKAQYSGGTQGESGPTREAYLHQRRQWKLDKPPLLNTRWFLDYSETSRKCAQVYGLGNAELRKLLGDQSDLVKQRQISPMLQFLRSLGIRELDDQILDPARLNGLPRLVQLGVQVLVEDELGEHGVKSLLSLLDDPDLTIRIGAIRCLTLCTLGDPFVYTYSSEPGPAETAGVVTTWKIWWDREHEKFKPLPPERQNEVQSRFRALVAEGRRSKIQEGVDSSYVAEDAPFFMQVLLGPSALKEKVVASTALRYKIGRPLKADVKVTDPDKTVRRVAENWKAYVQNHQGRFDPSAFARCVYLFSDTQYANSLWKLMRFDFGRSMVKPFDPAGPKILDAALVSAPIMLLSEAIVYVLAIPTGLYLAVRRNRWQDRAGSLTLFVLYSIPPVVLGMILLTFLSYGRPFLSIFPMYGLHSENSAKLPLFLRALDYAWHLFEPAVCLTITSIAGLSMFGRSSMLDVINQDYIRTAHAKGLSGAAVILRHALRNALIPTVTLFASFIPLILGGSVIIEVLFGIPGMGRLSFESIQAKDTNMVMALIYLDALVVMASILLSDLLYVVVDPRITFEKSEGGS